MRTGKKTSYFRAETREEGNTRLGQIRFGKGVERKCTPRRFRTGMTKRREISYGK